MVLLLRQSQVERLRYENGALRTALEHGLRESADSIAAVRRASDGNTRRIEELASSLRQRSFDKVRGLVSVG